MEFNPDGSLKLPEAVIKRNQELTDKMVKGRCITIKKDIVSDKSPKKCVLHIRLSDFLNDSRFVPTILNESPLAVPIKLVRLNEKEFDIEIGTDFRRCSDCTSLINRYKEFIEVIEDKGCCTYRNNFDYTEY